MIAKAGAHRLDCLSTLSPNLPLRGRTILFLGLPRGAISLQVRWVSLNRGSALVSFFTWLNLGSASRLACAIKQFSRPRSLSLLFLVGGFLARTSECSNWVICSKLVWFVTLQLIFGGRGRSQLHHQISSGRLAGGCLAFKALEVSCLCRAYGTEPSRTLLRSPSSHFTPPSHLWSQLISVAESTPDILNSISRA